MKRNVSNEKKVVFIDDGIHKTAHGSVKFTNGFVQVTDKSGRSILINKTNIVFIRDQKGGRDFD